MTGAFAEEAVLAEYEGSSMGGAMTAIELASKVKAFVVPELNLGQMVREVERAAAGKAKTFAVSHAGGSVHNPEDILKVIVEASRCQTV